MCRMGSPVISIDTTFSVCDKIHDTVDSETVLKPTEEERVIDARGMRRFMEVGVLTLLNGHHFSFEEVLVPRASEEHSFVAPEIAIFIGWLMKYSEPAMEGLNLKHDGLECNRYILLKVQDCLQQIFGKQILNVYSSKIGSVETLMQSAIVS